MTTPTLTLPDPFDLDAALDRALDWQAALERRDDEQEAAREANEARTLAEHQQRLIDDLRQNVDAVLPPALQQAVNLHYEPGTNLHASPTIVLTIDGERWTMWPGQQYQQHRWKISRPGRTDAIEVKQSDDHPLNVAGTLLLAIAKRRAERSEEHRRQAEHERCQARIAEATVGAQRELWQWPAGREITLYHWQWQCGRHEDGSPYWDDTWATTNRLNDAGELITGSGKRITLFPLANHPVAEAHTFASVAELPRDLRDTTTITVPGIARFGDDAEPHYRAYADGVVYVEVGETPVEWARELVERM